MNNPTWMQQIDKTETYRLFPLLHNAGCGIGVDPNNYHAVCVKMVKPHVGTNYKNEIRMASCAEETDTIKYMMSPNRRDHLAFEKSFQHQTFIRVQICDGPKNYDCGWWIVLSLDIISNNNKHAILKRYCSLTHSLSLLATPHGENIMEFPEKNMQLNAKCRSALESQWARFFDALGIEYQFEPTVFTLLLGKTYTPDFYLPSIDTYLEIKPMPPCIDTMYKCAVLSAQSKKVVILGGYPTTPFVINNEFNEKTNRYEDDTFKRYRGMVFQNGKLMSSNSVFMEIDGKINIYDVTEHNTIYNQHWNTETLAKAYQHACSS